VIFSLLPLSLFVFKLVKLLHSTAPASEPRSRRRSRRPSRAQPSHTIGTAMLSGLVRTDRPFFARPRSRSGTHSAGICGSPREAALMAGLWLRPLR